MTGNAAAVGPAFAKPPRFNHLAVSLAPDQLDAEGRAAIAEFYGDVLGFVEYPELTKDRAQLVLRAHHHEQFVFIVGEDEPMRAPRMDHVGLSVSTKDDFDEVASRAAAWKARLPDEVDLIEPHYDEHAGLLRLHSLYVKYRLPVMFELQHFEYLL